MVPRLKLPPTKPNPVSIKSRVTEPLHWRETRKPSLCHRWPSDPEYPPLNPEQSTQSIGGGVGTVEQTPSSAPQVNYLPHQPVIWRMQTNKNIFTLLNHDYNLSIHTVSTRLLEQCPMHIKYSSIGFWIGSALVGPRLTKICNLYSK